MSTETHEELTDKNLNPPKAEKKPDKATYMYLGPNLPGGALFNGYICKGLPENLEQLFQTRPEVEELFVEVKDVPVYKRELSRSGSEAARLYQNIEIHNMEIQRKEKNNHNGRI